MREKQQTKLFKTQTGMFFRKYSLYFFLFFLLILIPLLVYLSMNWDAKRIINGLSVEGNDFVPQKIIKSLIADSLYKKEKGKIELSEIRSIIGRYPFVKEVDVIFANDNKVKIFLKMRQPVARFGNSKSDLHFIAENGFIMPYLFFDNFSHLPFLRNCYSEQVIDSSKLGYTLSVLNNINKNYNVISGSLSEIDIENNSKIELLVKPGKIRVIMGDTLRMKRKLDKLEVFLKRWIKTKHKREIKSIDLRWSRQAVML